MPKPLAAEITKWQSKVAELEQALALSPSDVKLTEMLRDANNNLRYVSARSENMSKQMSR